MDTIISSSLDYSITSSLDSVQIMLHEDILLGKPPVLRSTHWETVRKHHLEENPACAACGSTGSVQVHHMHPFHLFPQLELDPTNFITLCESPLTNVADHHLELGHKNDWKNFNQNVLVDVDAYRTSKTKLGELTGYDFTNVKRILNG